MCAMASRIQCVAVAVTLLVLCLAPAAEARTRDPSCITIFRGKFNVTTTVVKAAEAGKTTERKELWAVVSKTISNYTSMFPGNVTVLADDGETPISQRRLQMHFYGKNSGAIALGPHVPVGEVNVDDRTTPVESFLRYELERESDPKRKSAKGAWKEGNSGGMYELTASSDEISIILMDTVKNEIRRMRFERTERRKGGASEKSNMATIIGLVIGIKLLQFGLRRIFSNDNDDDTDIRTKKTR